MLLKRIFDHTGGSPVLKAVKVLRHKKRQNFSTKFIEQQTASGLVSMGDGVLSLRTEPPLKYKIISGPGYYCCHCGIAVSGAEEARKHIDKEHKKKASLDKGNPAGYRRDNHYACEVI